MRGTSVITHTNPNKFLEEVEKAEAQGYGMEHFSTTFDPRAGLVVYSAFLRERLDVYLKRKDDERMQRASDRRA